MKERQSLTTRHATGRPATRPQRVPEEETAVIVAVISIGNRQSHAARPILKLESLWINQSARKRHATSHPLITMFCSFTHAHAHIHTWTCAQRSFVRLVRIQS